MGELLGPIRQAADQLGKKQFLELLRWNRAVVELLELDNGAESSTDQ